MQPQDNNIPEDQTAGSVPSGDPVADQSAVMGGATFQPQSNPQPPGPVWQNDAVSDSQQLYAQQDQAGGGSSTMPPNPLLQDHNPTEVSSSSQAMNEDFNKATNLTAPMAPGTNQPLPQPAPATPPMPLNPLTGETPAPSPQTVMPPPVSPGAQEQVPIAPAASATPETSQVPPLTPSEPNIANEPPQVPPLVEANTGLPPDMSQDSMSSQQYPTRQPGLPGADQLGMAAAGMDQSASSIQTGYSQDLTQGADMGVYGPPPKNNKKIIFIIVGAVIGLTLIVGIVLLISSSSRNKQSTQTVTTTTEQQQTQPTTTPTSGPATPPEGYVTIDKQCYTFALFNPNTVPTDQACSFESATFGKQKTSTISVITTTETLKSIDDYFTLVKQNVTVVSEEATKLDNIDAKQLIYKASDGKTYSEVAALIVGKNYQQDGKAVTAVSLKTSYQITFDQEVTRNVIDTWRWK